MPLTLALIGFAILAAVVTTAALLFVAMVAESNHQRRFDAYTNKGE